MAIQFIVDSGSGITKHEAQQMGVTLLPMTISFGDDSFQDGFDLDNQRFYTLLAEREDLPHTSQINPAAFRAALQPILAQGDEAVVITLSSKLSGTYQNGVIAAQDAPERVFVVDSENATVGERILLEYGLRLRDQGYAAAEIAAALDREKKQIRLVAFIDTLEYLKKGGRISDAAAFVGSILSIKPVIEVQHGEVIVTGKVRGTKQGNRKLLDTIQGYGGIDFSKPFSLLYSGLSDAPLHSFVEDSPSLWQGCQRPLPTAPLGATIGTHIGPGAVGIAFWRAGKETDLADA